MNIFVCCITRRSCRMGGSKVRAQAEKEAADERQELLEDNEEEEKKKENVKRSPPCTAFIVVGITETLVMVLMMVGMSLTYASTYQLLRSSVIIFSGEQLPGKSGVYRGASKLFFHSTFYSLFLFFVC